MRGSQKHAITFVFITMLIDITGIGIIIPGLPDLLKNLGGGSMADASIEGGWLMFAYSIVQFFFSPIIGGLSDQYGRRPIILASLFGFGVDFLFTAFAPTLAWLFVGRIFAGLFGASFSTAGAYIADVSPPEKRAANFGLIGAAFGLGFIIGPLIGSLLAPFGDRMPFFVASGLAFVNLVYGFFVLPESLSKDNRRPFTWSRANPFGTFKVIFNYPKVLSIIIPFSLIILASYSSQSTWAYYTREKFGWGASQVGYSLAAVGLMAAIVQGGLSRLIIPKLGDIKSIYWGLTASIIGTLGYGLATNNWHLGAAILIASFGGISMAALQGVLSNQVPPNAQGELRGGITSIMSLAAIVGPLLMTNIFAYFTKDKQLYYPGAPFYLGFVILIIALMLLFKSLGSNEQRAIK